MYRNRIICIATTDSKRVQKIGLSNEALTFTVYAWKLSVGLNGSQKSQRHVEYDCIVYTFAFKVGRFQVLDRHVV